jgi:hypothetical protein
LCSCLRTYRGFRANQGEASICHHHGFRGVPAQNHLPPLIPNIVSQRMHRIVVDSAMPAVESPHCATTGHRGAWRSYPSFDYSDTNDETVLLPLITKSTAWSHELEFRLIAEDSTKALSTATLKVQDDRLSIPSHALTAVILGHAIPPPARAEIRRLIDSRMPHVELMQATLIPNHFGLRIEPVIGG